MTRHDVDALLSEMDPSIEWHPTEDFAEVGPFVGTEGIRRMVGFMLDSFDEFSIEAEELIDFDGRVVAPVHQTGRGKGSGAPVEVRYVLVFTFRDGKSVRVDSYYDRDDAVRAAGSTPAGSRSIAGSGDPTGRYPTDGS